MLRRVNTLQMLRVNRTGVEDKDLSKYIHRQLKDASMKFLARPLHNLYSSALRNSKYRWLIVAASLLYLLSPFDLVSDFIPVMGWVDDGVIATVLVAEVSGLLQEKIRSRRQKDQSLSVMVQS
jgi:uncharacterized membrane protein YkvA (DUF1232 family)